MTGSSQARAPRSTERITNMVITEILPNDVMMGRGAAARNNKGNVSFLRLVRSRKNEYLRSERTRQKQLLAKQIMDEIMTNRNGRFVRLVQDPAERLELGMAEDDVKAYWVLADKVAVLEKIKQALRDKDLPESRKDIPSASTERTTALEASDVTTRPLTSTNNQNHQGRTNAVPPPPNHDMVNAATVGPVQVTQLLEVRRRTLETVLNQQQWLHQRRLATLRRNLLVQHQAASMISSRILSPPQHQQHQRPSPLSLSYASWGANEPQAVSSSLVPWVSLVSDGRRRDHAASSMAAAFIADTTRT